MYGIAKLVCNIVAGWMVLKYNAAAVVNEPWCRTAITMPHLQQDVQGL